MATLESIAARCERADNGCLIWLGAITRKTGYSRIGHKSKVYLGHRLVFILARRELQEREHVDHTCHNEDTTCVGGSSCIHRRCLNPDHLEAVSQEENNRRAREHAERTPGARYTGIQRGTCKKGLHPWIPENIGRSLWKSRVLEFCRPCRREVQRAYERRVAAKEGRTMTVRMASRVS